MTTTTPIREGSEVVGGLWQLRRVTMTSHAGLDVSQQATQICILDATGTWTAPRG